LLEAIIKGKKAKFEAGQANDADMKYSAEKDR
jgi:hypothetical protein